MIPDDEAPALDVIEEDTDTDGVQYPPADTEASPPDHDPPPQELTSREAEMAAGAAAVAKHTNPAAPINIAEPEAPRPLLVEDFIEKMNSERNMPVKEYVPPPVTEKQHSARSAEMEAGRKRVAHYEEQKKLRLAAAALQQQATDPREGTSTPVFRPREFVPVDPALSRLSR